MKVKINKLVRDKVPQELEKEGKLPKIKTLQGSEFKTQLRKKLEEEVAEYLESTESEELADILEVVYALAKLSGITKTQLERLRLKKLAEKGGFKDKIFLIEKNG